MQFNNLLLRLWAAETWECVLLFLWWRWCDIQWDPYWREQTLMHILGATHFQNALFGTTAQIILVTPRMTWTNPNHWKGRLGGGFKYFFFIFIPVWGRFPFWLIFFRWVETTNQPSLKRKIIWTKPSFFWVPAVKYRGCGSVRILSTKALRKTGPLVWFGKTPFYTGLTFFLISFWFQCIVWIGNDVVEASEVSPLTSKLHHQNYPDQK